MLGVSPQYQNIRNLVVVEGRFLDETDDTADIKCAVVTETVCPGAVWERGRGGGIDV